MSKNGKIRKLKSLFKSYIRFENRIEEIQNKPWYERRYWYCSNSSTQRYERTAQSIKWEETVINKQSIVIEEIKEIVSDVSVEDLPELIEAINVSIDFFELLTDEDS